MMLCTRLKRCSNQLAVTGAFAAAGNLNVNWVNNTPPAGALNLALLKYASITGMLNTSKPPNSTVTTNKTETDLNYTPPG